MIGSDFMDEIDCGSFFDQIEQIEDLIEFPAVNEGGLGSGNCKDFPSIWSNPPAGFPGSGPIFSGHHSSNVSELSAELAVPVEDIVQLEWLSNFMEDSFSGGGLTLGKENSPVTKDSSHNQFQTSSPVSVLESSTSSSSSNSSSSNNSTCSLGKTLPLVTQHGPQRARSKRPRPATFNPRPAMQLISPSSSTTENSQLFSVPVASFDNFADSSRPLKKIPRAASVEHKKKKKLKLSLPLGPLETNQSPPSQGIRKCLHCEITKTPQWRAGPMGPKTLCNACGVRYKSGRLFPEYRPAASPTFIPSLHSNSHKKVVEMRTKGSSEKSSVVMTVTTTPTFAEPELIPNINPSLEGVGA